MAKKDKTYQYKRLKRSEIENRRRKVARLHLHRYLQSEIAAKLEVSEATVSRDLKVIQKAWENAYIEDRQKRLMRELAELEEMELQAAQGFLDERDPKWLNSRNSIKNSKRAMLGLNAPTQVSGPDGGPISLATDLADVAQRGFELLAANPSIAEALKAQAQAAARERDAAEQEGEDDGSR